uniref:Uncharacterized protein n=1 Tax=Caenorhabditis japonica TaxID=281687 RepID=A0A8R1EB51_CAEJA
MVDATRIFPLPAQFAETPPFAVPCTLAAEEGTLDDLENEIFRWRTIFADNLAGKCYIKRAGGGSCDITDNGVKACGVHLFITVLGKPKSVVDVNL